MALGNVDTFEFRLARDLGRTVAEVRQMSNLEFNDWHAFYRYEAHHAEHAAQVAESRRG
jgi:hypothetical protein